MKRRVGWFALLALMASAVVQAAPQMPMVDGDADGVGDERDECPYTEPNIRVNRQGCALLANDGDADGISDARDGCPYTPSGAQIDAKGCALDADFDGIANGLDACPGSALSERVGDNGCKPGERETVAVERRPAAIAPMPEVVKPGDAVASTGRGVGKRASRTAMSSSAAMSATAPTPALDTEIIAAASSAPAVPTATRTEVAAMAAAPKSATPVTRSREEMLAMEASRKEAAAARRAGLPVGGTVDASVRPPSTSDRIKPEVPSAAYRAARGEAMPAISEAAPAPEPAPRASKPASRKSAPSGDAAPRVVEPTPAARPVPTAPKPETITPSPAPGDAGSTAAPTAPAPVAALLASLEQEGRTAMPAGNTPEQTRQAAGEKPESVALTVRFPSAANELGEPAAGQVRSLGNALRQLSKDDPALKVHLAAYAGRGEGRELAEQRLTRVRAMLLGRGIPADRIVAENVRAGGAGRVVISTKGS